MSQQFRSDQQATIWLHYREILGTPLLSISSTDSHTIKKLERCSPDGHQLLVVRLQSLDMGFFGDDDGDDNEKSFRERVNDIQEERKNQHEQQSQEQSGNQSQSEGQLPIPDSSTEVTVDADIQQWEYLTYDLIEEIDKADPGFVETMLSQSDGPPLPPDELLNELGKEGWKLVETVEKPAATLDWTEIEGSMTHAFIFRRPVTYGADSE